MSVVLPRGNYPKGLSMEIGSKERRLEGLSCSTRVWVPGLQTQLDGAGWSWKRKGCGSVVKFCLLIRSRQVVKGLGFCLVDLCSLAGLRVWGKLGAWGQPLRIYSVLVFLCLIPWEGVGAFPRHLTHFIPLACSFWQMCWRSLTAFVE